MLTFIICLALLILIGCFAQPERKRNGSFRPKLSKELLESTPPSTPPDKRRKRTEVFFERD